MADGETYSLMTGLIFVFNLILGTGVLTMPSVFATSGWLFGVLIIVLLCFVSYVQTTFVVEAMANANFYNNVTKYLKEIARANGSMVAAGNDGTSTDQLRVSLSNLDAITVTTVSTGEAEENGAESQPDCAFSESKTEVQRERVVATLATVPSELDDKSKHVITCLVPKLRVFFSIKAKYEFGHLSELFFGRLLMRFFFTSIIVYLLGDLLIYNTMMSKSLRVITCTNKLNETLTEAEQLAGRCWSNLPISRTNVYRIYLLAFALLLTPLTYFKLQKTKMIQVVTIVLRWLAFLSMIGITLKMFLKRETNGHPKVADVWKMPKLFGICIYSFMCHHSLPSFLSPIRNKTYLNFGIFGSYLLALFFYLVIAFTGIFAFENLDDVYTLNFASNGNTGNGTDAAVIPFFDIFLPTFPIFTLFSSYIFIAITLINNIKILLFGSIDNYNPKYTWLGYVLPVLALSPPLVVAMFTEDVASIVSYVGSYTGSLIQYVFPALFVYYSRRAVIKDCLTKFIEIHLDDYTVHIPEVLLERLYHLLNHHVSPFRSTLWVYATGLWWAVSIVLVTAQHILESVEQK